MAPVRSSLSAAAGSCTGGATSWSGWIATRFNALTEPRQRLSDAADQLAPRHCATSSSRPVQDAVERERRNTVTCTCRLKIPRCQRKIASCGPWRHKNQYRHRHTVKEARQQLGVSVPPRSTGSVKEGGLSVVKIGRRSFVHAEDLDDFLSRCPVRRRRSPSTYWRPGPRRRAATPAMLVDRPAEEFRDLRDQR